MVERSEKVNLAIEDPRFLAELETTLSPERLATYRAKTHGDIKKAMRLYVWNTAVSSAFYGPLQSLEVSLRNAINRELSNLYGPDWFDNPVAGLDLGARNKVHNAKSKLRKDGYPVDPPHIIASLSFGFWVSLLGAGGKMDRTGRRKANYEMTLWRPALRHAFPHKTPLNRKKSLMPLEYLRTFRNRIAHHEPIFARRLAKDYETILEISAWIAPEKRTWIERHSRVSDILTTPWDQDGLKY